MNQGQSAAEHGDGIDAASAAQPPRLEMRQITKNFGGVHALRDVSLTSPAGEVHALCGENGAGKSTLMKILADAITDYEGEIVLAGRSVRFSGPRQAEDAGIRIIYQELNLVPQLTVADNIFLGRERVRGGWLGWLDEHAMEERARRLFDRGEKGLKTRLGADPDILRLREEAATVLGISRNALARKIRRLGITA